MPAHVQATVATTPVLILGASARAAAWSALRAGLSPAAADLFADRDLAAIATSVRVEASDYPAGLADAASAFPPSPWIYTGALENHPDIVDRLAQRRPLWGNSGAALRAARDPLVVAQVLGEAGCAAPEVCRDPRGLPRDGSWVRKPWASAGGRGVSVFDADARDGARPVYYQRRINGLSLAVMFVAHAEGVFVAGVTRQLIGRPGASFAYRGSVGPWPVSAAVWRQYENLGTALAARLGLIGLFGVDLILDGDGVAWPVEINPRYTASVEVLELATGRALLDDHRRACEGRPLPPRTAQQARVVAKEVIFAEADGVFPDVRSGLATVADPFAVPALADVPLAGSRFRAGDPVLTIFAEGATTAAALDFLEQKRARWRNILQRLDISDQVF